MNIPEMNVLEVAAIIRDNHDTMRYGTKPWFDVTNQERTEDAEKRRLSKIALVAQLRAWRPEHEGNWLDTYIRPTLAKAIAVSTIGETDAVILRQKMDWILGVLSSGRKGIIPSENELESLIIDVNDV